MVGQYHMSTSEKVNPVLRTELEARSLQKAELWFVNSEAFLARGTLFKKNTYMKVNNRWE